MIKSFIPLVLFIIVSGCSSDKESVLRINRQNYFELPGLNVMVFEDIYPEGHQGGIGFIQHGERVATNGDVRLELTPGQFQPIPKVGKRTVDSLHNEISVNLWYPDSSINRKGYNPVIYPDIHFAYTVRVIGEKDYFKIIVDMNEPVPAEWLGKIGFNLELYPTDLFGKTWMMDNKAGFFPPQANGPVDLDANKDNQAVPLAIGRTLVVAPETEKQRFSIESATADLQLLDGRIRHTNGWFVVRSAIPQGATKGAIEWTIKANHIPNWIAPPVIHVSQVGYHTRQPKKAVIELDAADKKVSTASLLRLNAQHGETVVKKIETFFMG